MAGKATNSEGRCEDEKKKNGVGARNEIQGSKHYCIKIDFRCRQVPLKSEIGLPESDEKTVLSK